VHYQELHTADYLHSGSIDVPRGASSRVFTEVNNHLFSLVDIKSKVVVLTPVHQVHDFNSVRSLIIVIDET